MGASWTCSGGTWAAALAAKSSGNGRASVTDASSTPSSLMGASWAAALAAKSSENRRSGGCAAAPRCNRSAASHCDAPSRRAWAVLHRGAQHPARRHLGRRASLQPQRLQRLAALRHAKPMSLGRDSTIVPSTLCGGGCAAALLRCGASSRLPAVPDSHSSCEASSYLCDTPSCDKWHGCGVTRCDGCSALAACDGQAWRLAPLHSRGSSGDLRLCTLEGRERLCCSLVDSAIDVPIEDSLLVKPQNYLNATK